MQAKTVCIHAACCSRYALSPYFSLHSYFTLFKYRQILRLWCHNQENVQYVTTDNSWIRQCHCYLSAVYLNINFLKIPRLVYAGSYLFIFAWWFLHSDLKTDQAKNVFISSVRLHYMVVFIYLVCWNQTNVYIFYLIFWHCLSRSNICQLHKQLAVLFFLWPFLGKRLVGGHHFICRSSGFCSVVMFVARDTKGQS